MIVALTWGGFMCTLSFPPTSKRTVAENFVWVFSTWGGCFSIINVLQRDQKKRHCSKPRFSERDNSVQRRQRLRTHLVTSADMTSVTVALSSVRSSSVGPGMGSCCVRCSTRRICCLFCQIISANFSHLHSQNKNIKYSQRGTCSKQCRACASHKDNWISANFGLLCYHSVAVQTGWHNC